MKDNSSVTSDLVQLELMHIWCPCAQMKDFEDLPIIPLTKGDDVWLEDFDGKKYIEAISSL